MNTTFKKLHTQKGFALIEILITCAILSLCVFALFSAAQKGVHVSDLALRQTQATALLEEGSEAVKSIRDTSWSSISSLTDGARYYVSFDSAANAWSLSTTPTDPIDGVFTRFVVVQTATRDSTDDIAIGGTPDDHTKQVTVTVEFPSSDGTPTSKEYTFYITDIF